jgi:hypothetical protein
VLEKPDNGEYPKVIEDPYSPIYDLLNKLNYAARATLLREIMQNMNERAEATSDMGEIAMFVMTQLGSDAPAVIEAHTPVKRKAIA